MFSIPYLTNSFEYLFLIVSMNLQMGLIHGCHVEDIILASQSGGCKSVYFNLERKPFTGVTPVMFEVAIVQQKR